MMILVIRLKVGILSILLLLSLVTVVHVVLLELV